jgi:hypothetical protein
MSEINEFDFKDITPATKDVKNLGGRNYLLNEASTDAASRYRNIHFSGARYEDGKLSKVEGIANADAVLLSCCITYSDGAEKGQLVPIAIVNKWPERVTKPMVQWVKDNSDIDTGEDPLKVALQEGLKREDSPLTFDALCDWLKGWDDEARENKKTRPLYRLLQKTIEERSKNGPGSMTASSA